MSTLHTVLLRYKTKTKTESLPQLILIWSATQNTNEVEELENGSFHTWQCQDDEDAFLYKHINVSKEGHIFNNDPIETKKLQEVKRMNWSDKKKQKKQKQKTKSSPQPS